MGELQAVVPGDHEINLLILFLVEVGEGTALHVLVLLAPRSRHWQGLQVQEFGGHKVLLRQQQVAEDAWRVLHTVSQSVRDGLDEVLGRHMLVRWYKELDCVRSELLLEQEEFAVGDVRGVDIFHWNPGSSTLLVHLLSPPEGRGEFIALKISLHLQGRLLANVVQGGATWEFLSI